MRGFSQVEMVFFRHSRRPVPGTRVPYVVVDNFPQLGFFTALRFLEWVAENPEGVVSLPTGKTPEYFIKWVMYLLENWNAEPAAVLRREHGLTVSRKPDLRGLQFVQIDEFYPVSPRQANSFYHYVNRYYIKGFGLDPGKAQLINCDRIPRPAKLPVGELFPGRKVDLSLRYRNCRTGEEVLRQQGIFLVDQWCSEYEQKVRDKGGIGFFLGGIGPDGHIAFNVRGSDLNCTTRLTETNFETQAAAATDLGGLEISRNRLVITIGLATITHNPEATTIIFAAGAAKARIVQESLESPPAVTYPATVLQRLPNSRFYLTAGAASRLLETQKTYYQRGRWTREKTQRSVIDLTMKLQKFGTRLTPADLKNDPFCARNPRLGATTVPAVLETIKKKIQRGITVDDRQRFLHTGPHHDDIMLGFLPHLLHLVRSPRNHHHFAIMTSGFTSVTNQYIIKVLKTTRRLLRAGLIQMIEYADFYDQGYRLKWDKDVFHTLDRMAGRNQPGCERGLSHRVVRALVDIYAVKSTPELDDRIGSILDYLAGSYDGEKNPPDIQKLKGMIREFEEELVWAHYGIQVKNVSHLRLGFYTGDIFTEKPDRARDVRPVLNLLQEFQPTVISLALDPEGSGPDTHYKVLQALAEAVREWGSTTDLSRLRIWGYRNVWYRFDLAETNLIVPVSLNALASLRDTFMNCYLSQKDASFPSHELDGPFCDLAQMIWVEQFHMLELLLGKDYWYQNEHPRLRAAHGALFMKEMTVNQFLTEARRLEESMEGRIF